MNRHYFVSDSLDDMEQVETELEQAGVVTPQIHVLSKDESGVESHHLHGVTDFMKTDVIRSGLIGLAIGVVGALIVLGLAYFNQWPAAIGWTPFVFLATIIFGFCTWEGGFLGFQVSNAHFRRFEAVLDSNRHVLFVDVNPEQEPLLKQVMSRHPGIEPAGDGGAAPAWIVKGQRGLSDFAHWAP